MSYAEESSALRKIVEEKLKKIKSMLNDNDYNKNEYSKTWHDLVCVAVELHKIVQPKHHNYMIKNRGCSPDEPEFYNHIHPIEDLLSYMDNPNANDDPKDITLENSFKFKVYSRRWGHHDMYTFTRNLSGWIIERASANNIQSDKTGAPVLYNIFSNDSINFPHDLGSYLEWLWNKAAEDGLTHNQVQSYLNDLSEWVSICEKNTPRGIFRGYN